MAKRNWKRQRGTSMRNAMELCVRYARDVHNLSVERIAELMGLENHFTLYKWMESGRMPAVLIRSFENACQCDYVTKYIAYSANKLVIDMPTGRRPAHKELNELSVYAHTVIGKLISFFETSEDEAAVIQAVNTLIEDLAHQRGNVEKYQQPELLGDES
jgi:hypothetical protein